MKRKSVLKLQQVGQNQNNQARQRQTKVGNFRLSRPDDGDNFPFKKELIERQQQNIRQIEISEQQKKREQQQQKLSTSLTLGNAKQHFELQEPEEEIRKLRQLDLIFEQCAEQLYQVYLRKNLEHLVTMGRVRQIIRQIYDQVLDLHNFVYEDGRDFKKIKNSISMILANPQNLEENIKDVCHYTGLTVKQLLMVSLRDPILLTLSHSYRPFQLNLNLAEIGFNEFEIVQIIMSQPRVVLVSDTVQLRYRSLKKLFIETLSCFSRKDELEFRKWILKFPSLFLSKIKPLEEATNKLRSELTQQEVKEVTLKNPLVLMKGTISLNWQFQELQNLGLDLECSKKVLIHDPSVFGIEERYQDFKSKMSECHDLIADRDLWNTIFKKFPDLAVLESDQICGKIHHLQNRGFTQDDIISIISNVPQILDTPQARIDSSLYFLSSKGYATRGQMSQLARDNPQIFKSSLMKLEKNWRTMFKLQFSREQVYSLAFKSQILNLYNGNLMSKIRHLKDIFVDVALIYRFCMACPCYFAVKNMKVRRLWDYLYGHICNKNMDLAFQCISSYPQYFQYRIETIRSEYSKVAKQEPQQIHNLKFWLADAEKNGNRNKKNKTV